MNIASLSSIDRRIVSEKQTIVATLSKTCSHMYSEANLMATGFLLWIRSCQQRLGLSFIFQTAEEFSNDELSSRSDVASKNPLMPDSGGVQVISYPFKSLYRG